MINCEKTGTLYAEYQAAGNDFPMKRYVPFSIIREIWKIKIGTIVNAVGLKAK